QWSEDFAPDLVESVLAARFDDVVDARDRLRALAALKPHPDFVPLAVAFKRAANIQEKAAGAGATTVDPALFREEAERLLASRLDAIDADYRAARARRDYPAALKAVAAVKPEVDRFFDDVMVMAEDASLRANRLALIRKVSDLFADIADFKKIQ